MEWGLIMLVSVTIFLVTAICALIYYYMTLNYDFWKTKNIPYVQGIFPFGNATELVLGQIDMGRYYERFYYSFKEKKYGGIYEVRNPVLILADLDLVKQIFIKDFNHFADRAILPVLPHDYLMKNLFFMNEEDGWKEMRRKLTPTFSSGKMKLIFSLIEKCSLQLKQYLEPLANYEETIDVKDVISRFTLDIIATSAFGLEINSLSSSSTEFYKISQMIFNPSRTFFLERFLTINFPAVANYLKLTMIVPQVKNFVETLIDSSVKNREENNIKRNDFLDQLIEIRDNLTLDASGNKKRALTLEEIAAQAFVFIAAGFETTASATTFALYELACNPRVQERLRKEVDEVVRRHGGRVTYQALQEMTYMEQVVKESLRKHGSARILVRTCVEPYTFPNSDLKIEKGIKVVIPMYAIHHDPDIYPEPEVFDPDRFAEEHVAKRHSCAYLSFGEGPRMCIAKRFGTMQVKAGLATIISNFELSVTPETPIPIVISPRIAITTPLHPIKLRISKRISGR